MHFRIFFSEFFHIFFSKKSFSLTCTKSLGERNIVVFLVSSQIRVFRLSTYDALAVRVAQNATMVPLAHATQRFTTELRAQVLVREQKTEAEQRRVRARSHGSTEVVLRESDRY